MRPLEYSHCIGDEAAISGWWCDTVAIFMTLCRIAFVGCVLAAAAAAQDLSPEMILLSRIKAHMATELAQLPNYTCLETIARFHKEPRAPRLKPLDSMGLEVVYSGRHEWYGLPGDVTLSEENPASFIGAGMIGNGMFGIALHNLFVADAAQFTARGEDSINGRRAVKYDFRLPRVTSKFEIALVGGRGTVGEEGSFWADPQTLDLLRLDAEATEIPAFLPLAFMKSTVSYARTRIGEFDALLAQQADLQMRGTDGVGDFDHFDFTHCRAYQTVSTIRFDANPLDASKAPDTAKPEIRVAQTKIPALLADTIQLTTPITDRDPVGRLIEAKVVGDVKYRGNVVIASGAPVRGRVRRLDQAIGKAIFAVGLEFTEVQVQGTPVRFYADLLRLDKMKGVQPELRQKVVLLHGDIGNLTLVLPELPGVASFFVTGKTFTLPVGFRTVWRTRGPIRGVQ